MMIRHDQEDIFILKEYLSTYVKKFETSDHSITKYWIENDSENYE
jgi:hypothetical protein